jgi:hypothetical protein
LYPSLENSTTGIPIMLPVSTISVSTGNRI